MASASTGAMPTVQEALEMHKIVLNGNLELWKAVEQEHGLDQNVKLLVSQGYQDTLAMINACAELEARLSKITNAKSGKGKSKRPSSEPDSSPTPNSKRRRMNGKDGNAQPSAPVVDASGLFMIDPNPADVNALLGESQSNSGTERKKKKRRHSESQNDDSTEPQAAGAELSSRKKRRRAGIATKSPEHSEPNAEEVNQTNATVNDDEAHQQSFEAKVALRLKEKEEQRKKKAVKKRKRSSEVSMVVDENQAGAREEAGAETSKKARKPRAKKAKSDVAEEEAVPSKNKKQKRSRQ